MGSPRGPPPYKGHVVATVFGCVCPSGTPDDLLEPLRGASRVQPAADRLRPARRLRLPEPLCRWNPCGGTTAGTAGTSACTIEGDVIFSQNGLKDVLCGNNAGLTISIRGSGLTACNQYKLFLESASGCTLATATRTEIVEITAPVLGLNGGINVYMCVDGYNVDGSTSKTAVDGMYVAIQDTTSTATTVGCGTAVLA